jgi:hypothetical protein
MAIIRDLVLALSRDSDGRVGVKVTYTAEFTPAETGQKVKYVERFYFLKAVGKRDWDFGPPPGDPKDVPIFSTEDYFNASTADADDKLKRSFEKTLTDSEVATLLEPGHEHLYLLASLTGVEISGDQKTVEVTDVDVGDPSGPKVILVPPPPG